jgi:AmiR/NasT family two-component response regulator
LATGIVMERNALGEDDALVALLRRSLQSGEPLRRHAEKVVLSTGGAGQRSIPNADG